MTGVVEANTHRQIDPCFSGHIIELAEGEARLELALSEEMRADERGLVHGGFLFSLADHAAMLAINHPNVVLGSAQVKFLRPVVVGDSVLAHARLERQDGKKQMVQVQVQAGERLIFEGEFTCFSPSRHVLENSGG